MVASSSLKSLDSVKGIVILEKSGERIAVQYFATSDPMFKDFAAQTRFEKGCFNKCKHSCHAGPHPDIVEHQDHIILTTRLYGGAFAMLIADEDENEIMLADVIQGFTDAIQSVLQRQQDVMKDGWYPDSTALQEVQLLVDEICEAGAILEKDSAVLLSRIKMQEDHVPQMDAAGGGGPNVADFLDKAKEAMRKNKSWW